jgi:Tol biopolymer transport system component
LRGNKLPLPDKIERVSVATDGSEGDQGSSRSSFSADGRYVTFLSDADLLPGVRIHYTQVFVHDRETGETTLASITTDGGVSRGWSSSPSLSADGRYVTFASGASDLVEGDDNGLEDIFVHDRQTGTTTRVSVATNGSQANEDSFNPTISADGRYVAFSSESSTLADGDDRGRSQIFVHDRETGETLRISNGADGTEARGRSYDPFISADGRFVTFYSNAADLIEGDGNGAVDLFVHDLMSGETTIVRYVNRDGSEPTHDPYIPTLSSDGRFVAFRSEEEIELTDGEIIHARDVLIYDRETAQTTRIEVTVDGDRAYLDDREGLGVSADGRFVTFQSASADLSGISYNQAPHIFVHDIETAETVRVDFAPDGDDNNIWSYVPAISADGRYITFSSRASNFVNRDFNDAEDVFTVRNPLHPDKVLTGTSGSELLQGGSGNDTINGLDGSDTLIGGDGDDVIVGGESETDLRDIVYGGAGNDNIDGGYGNDELRGDAGNDNIAGGFGADTVIGGAGNDTLTGSAYGDEIFGSDGLDFINGGFGHDRVNGGTGADQFYHLGITDHGSDWIQDYNAVQGDVLMWGGATATVDDFQINTADTANAGVDGVSESFVIYRPTGQIMWALVDGDAQSQINIQIAGQTFDLL